MEVVVLAPRCQGSDLLSVGCVIVASGQAHDGRVVSKHDGGVGAVGGPDVMREQGAKDDVVLPIRTAWGLPRKFRIQSQRAVLSPASLSLFDELGGHNGVKC